MHKDVIKEILPELRYPQLIPTTLEKLEDYSNNLRRLSIHQLQNNLRAFHSPRDSSNLYRIHPTQPPFTFQFVRDLETGKVLSYKEVETSFIGETAKNSLSLTRAHGLHKDGVKGNATNLPFWPGGFDEEKKVSTSKISIDADLDLDESEINNDLFTEDLLVSPPGLSTVRIEHLENRNGNSLKQFSAHSLQNDGISLDFWQGKTKAEQQLDNQSQAKLAKKESAIKRFLREIPDEICIPSTKDQDELEKVPVLKISKMSSHVLAGKNLPWAEEVDVTKPMIDFQEKVPDMAFKYPFQLDIFQQQAIYRLEEHENVFVAAHTSAGKTVVAEYAIALSVRHMTRTVYTSPIKALSNQKFRDFKNNFESVGLITGDVQINPTASCLIMTTEILRSMLYNGSDVIRDLEWVVFDEIHYLNNEERGHVWEEVLIMLPQHVSIIMLSATVPNALQFANWVGGIKKKKIYVLSTPKRPIPLEHHLYTGSGGKSRNEQFLIIDGSSKFIKKGYDDAKEAKLSRMSKHQQSFGARAGQKNTFNENFEKTLYVGLVSHLKENDKLPVVIFTFSRNRCDTYAKLLSSVDLCTGAQKAEIHGFFQKSIGRLKGSDKELPQVLTVQEMLKNGVGVHHSGILPILKEVVEMLFQKGLVKLLFATETFAMGVNMPARTVVFDSTRKHDGTQFRNLNPAEYIQMAGRAGRRGLDTTGTVIILCKHNIPDINELQMMMQGKAAKLESQFRLTYSMILNLLRVESLSVEDVMKRSFLEAGNRTLKVEDIKEKLEKVSAKLEELDFEPRNQEFSEYYSQVKDFLTLRSSLTEAIMQHPRTSKEFNPGRFVIFEMLPKFNARAGIIITPMVMKEGGKMIKKFKILTLVSDHDNLSQQDQSLFVSNLPNINLLEGHQTPDILDRKYQLSLYFAHNKLIDFVPDPPEYYPYPRHVLITVSGDNILEILGDSVRIDPNFIENDLRKREAPRFRNDMPGPHVLQTLQELYNFTRGVLESGYQPMLFQPLYNKLGPKGLQLEQQESLKCYDYLRMNLKVKNYFSLHQNFLQQFREVFFYMRLVEQKNHLEFLLSPKSLRLHEEYQARILVLQNLGYIDSENLVQLKGRVACEMGNQNELMVTEIIFNNILSDCPPVEVAALLSCMVFEAKHIPEPKYSPGSRLQQKVESIKSLARTIGTIQRECGVSDSIDNYVEQFKFGLVEVVYEWAQGKPFADIMNLTEVQEGIIVRTIQRLDEMLKDVKDAARIIGDPTLKKKMEEASECIKRDIVFAASLYTQ